MKRCVPVVLGLATLSCGSPSAPATQQHHNTTSVTLTVGSNMVSQGDTVPLGISFTPGDTPGDPLYIEISFDGSLPGVDTLTIPQATANDPTPASLSGYLVIPGGLPDGELKLTAVLPVEGDSSSATITVKDSRPPYIDSAYIAPGATPNAFIYNYSYRSNFFDLIAGATDNVVISAGDNHGVAWVGWSFGPPSNARDSVAVSGATIQASIPFTVPASLAGSMPTLSVFVRDSDGNMAAAPFGQVNVGSYVHHPVRTAAVDTAMTDIAYDAKRKVLYLSEPGHSNVLVLSLTNMTFQAPIALPVAPAGLDLTPGGDTLVVALANTSDLAFVTLAGTPATTVVQLKSLDSVAGDTTTFGSAARGVRVAADGRVIVATYPLAGQFLTGAVVQYDLSTGHDSVVFARSVESLARSGDATRVLIAGTGGATLYDGVAHQYTGSGEPGPPQNGIYLSANRNGTSFLIGNDLFDANLGAYSVVGDDNAQTTDGYGSAISDSGTTVWLGGTEAGCISGGGPAPCAANQPGFYFRLRVPVITRDQDGQLIEVADAPQGLVQLVALQGDSTLIGVGANEIMAFDLTTSTPGAVSSRVASHTLRPRARSVSARTDSRFDLRVKLRGKTRSLRFAVGRGKSRG